MSTQLLHMIDVVQKQCANEWYFCLSAVHSIYTHSSQEKTLGVGSITNDLYADKIQLLCYIFSLVILAYSDTFFCFSPAIQYNYVDGV